MAGKDTSILSDFSIKLATQKKASIRRALLRWFSSHARDLPWRKTTNPYAIWVSEVMLQQTRVETVIPYYNNFLDRFPSLQELAEAPEDDVLSAWSGLGYYRRARLLHRGVCETVERYGGQVPEEASERQSLPGIGKYTNGAIGSIAFGKQEPLVDGNVARVFARLFCIDTPLGQTQTERTLWAIASVLIEGKRPGDFNQSLMELGAVVCTPKNPSCMQCPVQKHCAAYKQNRVSSLPVPKPKKKPKPVHWVALIARDHKQPSALWVNKGTPQLYGGQLYGGLWNLPMKQTEQTPSLNDANELLKTLKLKAQSAIKLVGQVEHTLTHRRLHIEIFQCANTQGRVTAQKKRVDESELKQLGTSSLVHKILRAARQTSTTTQTTLPL